MRAIIGLCVCGVLLASCGGDREGTIETGNGEVEYSVDASEGSAEFRGTTDDGREVSISTGSDVPVDLPGSYTVYPGANIVSNSVVSMGDGNGSIVFMTTADSVADVAAFYRSQAEAQGIDIQMETNAADSTMLSGEGPDGKSFTVSASKNDAGTSIQLMVGEKLAE